jgi:hypothetical protein
MSIDPIDTGSECDGPSCRHKAHGVGLMDDADAAAEAKERALLAELAAARAEVERLRQVLVQVDRCLEHVVNRPHEHNPVGPFQRVSCEIVTDAQTAVRAALAAAPPRVTAEDFERLADVAEEGNRIAAASRRLRKELGLDAPPPSTGPHCHESPVYCLVCGRDTDAPPREERLAALGYEKPPPGSGTVGEAIGLRPVEEAAPDPLKLAEMVREECARAADGHISNSDEPIWRLDLAPIVAAWKAGGK